MTFSVVRFARPPASLHKSLQNNGPIALTSARALRERIPLELLMDLVVDAALTGKCKRVDPTSGEEVDIAQPITPDRQLDIAMKLIPMRLPALKSADEEPSSTPLLASDIEMSPEEIKRMPLSQLGKIIEATYTLAPTPHPAAIENDNGD